MRSFQSETKTQASRRDSFVPDACAYITTINLSCTLRQGCYSWSMGAGHLTLSKSPVCNYHIINGGPLSASHDLFYFPSAASVEGGECRPRSEAPGSTTQSAPRWSAQVRTININRLHSSREDRQRLRSHPSPAGGKPQQHAVRAVHHTSLVHIYYCKQCKSYPSRRCSVLCLTSSCGIVQCPKPTFHSHDDEYIFDHRISGHVATET